MQVNSFMGLVPRGPIPFSDLVLHSVGPWWASFTMALFLWCILFAIYHPSQYAIFVRPFPSWCTSFAMHPSSLGGLLVALVSFAVLSLCEQPKILSRPLKKILWLNVTHDNAQVRNVKCALSALVPKPLPIPIPMLMCVCARCHAPGYTIATSKRERDLKIHKWVE